jgi:hypothetical protein
VTTWRAVGWRATSDSWVHSKAAARELVRVAARTFNASTGRWTVAGWMVRGARVHGCQGMVDSFKGGRRIESVCIGERKPRSSPEILVVASAVAADGVGRDRGRWRCCCRVGQCLWRLWCPGSRGLVRAGVASGAAVARVIAGVYDGVSCTVERLDVVSFRRGH